ncbi:ammonium transporter [Candidatus Albibeggiatoa sp. nov. NOAA]|uniref:ammonium transporter n=1 Tax=Candidatus Albibeggiatoa sp. nov. NOAA TaxID=3162724 RepID=UPI00330041D4|nr:ammonium transporter [Thiotrichaceae bacterium]
MEASYALNTFYLLMSGALVMLMALGFSMLEAGLVRSKNTVEILTKNVTLYAIACIMYMLVGYDLMYGSPEGGIIPSVTPLFSFMSMTVSNDYSLAAVNAGEADYAKAADFFFQVVFVATAMSVVSGAIAERMKLWSFIFFAVVMTSFIYPIQGYWKWGEGFLHQLGFLDFAGSGVVHLAGATAALTGVMLLGARLHKFSADGHINAIPGANLPLATLGTFLLWFGWFGFNGGSQLLASTVVDSNTVAMIFVNTNMAAAGGLVAATMMSRFLFGKADLTMILNGALAGLVAITAEPSTPSPIFATLIGSVGGILVIFAILGLDKLRLDDPVGAISVHGVVGIWGLLAVPLTNPTASFKSQLIGIVVIFSWVFVTSLVTWFVIKLIFGLRVSEEEEYEGLDLSECGMEAYPEFVKN